MRFFVRMFSHETNTFGNTLTGRRRDAAHDLRHGGEILEAYRDTGARQIFSRDDP